MTRGRNRIATGVLVALLLLPAAGEARGVPAPTPAERLQHDGRFPYQRWIDDMRVPLPPVKRIEIRHESCGGGPPDGGRSCIGSQPDGSLRISLADKGGAARRAFYHELGHAFDYRVLDEKGQQRFLAILGRPDRVWTDPPNAPSEQFAEAYGVAASQGRHGRGTWGYNYRATAKNSRAFMRLLHAAAKRARGV